MAMWVFGYGSLIWKAGFRYDDRLVGFIKDNRRVFYQGSTDHRGTSEFPGRTVTLEPAKGEVCWGVAYKIIHKEDQEAALEHLEVREKQYDKKVYVNFYTESSASTPAVSSVMVYIASADKKLNKNYLGPASVDEIAVQILEAKGPSGPNRDYLFKLENALIQIGKYVGLDPWELQNCSSMSSSFSNTYASQGSSQWGVRKGSRPLERIFLKTKLVFFPSFVLLSFT